MTKRILSSVALIFITWSILDFVLHGILLQSTYEATADLWRPMQEMNMLLMYFVTLVFTTSFVVIYSFLIKPKSLITGIQYGILFGVATGFSMGFGSYSYMPIPVSLALSWFIGTLIESFIAGVIVGAIVKS